jgi:hypothetical protein
VLIEHMDREDEKATPVDMEENDFDEEEVAELAE